MFVFLLFSWIWIWKKIILLKISRGFSRPGHYPWTQHKAEVLVIGAGGCCLHPASPFLPEGGIVSSNSPSPFSLRQKRFPGHCPELNSLGSDKKNPKQSGLQFYIPFELAILKKHVTLDFWPDIQFFFFLIVIICSSSSVPTNRKSIIHSKVTVRCRHVSPAAPAACCRVEKCFSPC